MKVKDSPDFNAEYPERFDWGAIDSPTLELVATELASRIHGEMLLIAPQRIRTPGLRTALNQIAEVAEV